MACCVVTKGQTTQYYFLVLMFVLFFLFFIQVVFNHKKIIKTLPRSGILYYMQYLKLEVDLTILSRFYKIFWSFDIIPKRRG